MNKVFNFLYMYRIIVLTVVFFTSFPNNVWHTCTCNPDAKIFIDLIQ